MMKTWQKCVSVLCCSAILLPGCAWIKENQKTVLGGGIGAVAGGLAGGAYKGKKGAVWGAVIGGLAGAAIGQYLDRKDKTAAQTKQDHGYQPQQGVRLEMVGVGTDPVQVQPGKQVNLQATYAVMAPSDQQEFKVTETRILTHNGQKVLETPPATIDRASGTYTSVLPVTLPQNAPRGQYQLNVQVASAGQVSQQTSAFTVN